MLTFAVVLAPQDGPSDLFIVEAPSVSEARELVAARLRAVDMDVNSMFDLSVQTLGDSMSSVTLLVSDATIVTTETR